MRRLLLFAVMFTLALTVSPVYAARGTVLYVDDDLSAGCGGKTPCYPHPQDAVNAAQPGDTIRVYPGTYGSRVSKDCGYEPCNCSDSFAPALIVYKNRLILEAIDRNPANTVIEATHKCWSNPSRPEIGRKGPVEVSTAGGVNPIFGSAPNAVSIIASGVVLRGFTVLRPYIDFTPPTGHDTILIGGLYQGYGKVEGETLGFRGNTVSGCVMGGVDGVAIWHSADNTIAGNRIKEPVREAISIYDGWSDAEVGLPSPSTGNRVYGNRIIPGTYNPKAQAVFVGAWNQEGPTGKRTNNSGTLVYRNDCGGMGLFTAYSDRKKEFYDNTNVGWTGYCQASGYSFRGGPRPTDRCETSGVSKLQVGPPP
jgi:hypothetical protein